MKYILLILTFLFISCKAQTISLERRAECDEYPDNCPDFTYVKDINNTLYKYVGTWKGVYDGKTYEVQLKKGLYENFTGLKRDILIGRLRIITTGNSPQTIFDNFNEPDDTKTDFSGLGLASNLQHYMMIFGGPATAGCINYGTVYLTIKPATPTTLNIFFAGSYDIVKGECPSTFKTTIPEKQNIFLTKQ